MPALRRRRVVRRVKLPPQLFTGRRPEPERLKAPANAPRPKPAGGLWTSTYVDGTSAWETWCRETGYAHRGAAPRWILEPEEARVYVLQDAESVNALMESYGRPLPGMEDMDPLVSLELRGLDWQRFAAEWDALWLLSPWIDVDGLPLRLRSVLFYGWDCESTWWTRWKFGAVREVP